MKYAIWFSAFFSITTWAAPMTVSQADIIGRTTLASVARAQVKGIPTSILVDEVGMTLYTFDSDKFNVSACKGGCLTVWPPIHVPAGTAVNPPFGMITSNDGQSQLTLNGMPLYHYSTDKKPGDTFGEYPSWHVITVVP
jgi:predicted lipoprotein with Yx(FWY)xxD motif